MQQSCKERYAHNLPSSNLHSFGLLIKVFDVSI